MIAVMREVTGKAEESRVSGTWAGVVGEIQVCSKGQVCHGREQVHVQVTG